MWSRQWDNRKERRVKGRYNGWNRRVSWFDVGGKIRLKFETEAGSFSRDYATEADAQKDWEAFKTNTLR